MPSQFVRRRAIELLGLPPERVHAIPWGVDHERFRTGEDEREQFLLYPARPWPHKNHARLLQAFALLRQERPELKLVLTGGRHKGGPAPPGVDVRGLVSPEELASLYRRAACLVFPSLYEGFGQPPLEAMASGCPVAASNISGGGRGVRRGCGALRPERARRTWPPSSRASSTRRSGSPTQGSSALADSPGRRRPGGTRPSTARSV